MARRILENPNRPDDFHVEMVVSNQDVSGQPVMAKARLEVYPGLQLKTPQSIEKEAPPGKDALFTWRLEGRREDGRRLYIHWQGEKLPILLESKLLLEPRLGRALLKPGEVTALDVKVVNIGQAYALPEIELHASSSGQLSVISGTALSLPEAIPPGGQSTVSWKVKAVSDGAGAVSVTARSKKDQALVAQASARAQVVPDLAFLENQQPGRTLSARKADFEIRFSRGERGVRSFEALSHRAGMRLLARSPALGKVVYRDSRGPQERWLAGEQFGPTAADELRFRDTWKDSDGVEWKAEAHFKVVDSNWAEVECRLGVSASRELLAFQGPTLLAGEGSTGARKDSAMFPGVEWLAGEERSSSLPRPALAAPVSMERYVPHPNKVTVPVMAVTCDRRLIGLAWDPLQKWDGIRTRPSAFFASPNWLDGQNNHLMGLFVPGAPDGVSENTFQSGVPYPITPGREITLNFQILTASEVDDEILAVWLWYRRHGLPELPALARSFEEEMKIWRLTPDPFVDIVDYQHPQTLVKLAIPTIEAAHRWVQLQQNDGGWAIDWERDPGELVRMRLLKAWENWGRNSSSEITDNVLGTHCLSRYAPQADSAIGTNVVEGGISGIMPAKAITVLRAARLTGHPALLEAARRALERMDRFKRPEGAQAWEEPLHTPDIVAAACAVRAFVEGYRLTRESRWLDAAERWAGSGLPFIYV